MCENPTNHSMIASHHQGGSKPANFLQKLYDFLAIDPHPCPEVIYWASDSKQLVIAQPGRLAKEILPRLFKHDKIASFGRQLNIYGFSRLFPGRQFKDAHGNVSDASVWAHPTLHRLSTAAELSAIKRRAPPKLMRTRRLANGQVVRTRAGPGVIEKARQVKEIMSKDRVREKPYGLEANKRIEPTPGSSMGGIANKLPTASDGSTTSSGLAELVKDVQSIETGAHAGTATIESTLDVGSGRAAAKSKTALGDMLSQTPSPLISEIKSFQPFFPQSLPRLLRAAQCPTLALTSTLQANHTHNVANKLSLLKDRPYVSCPASIHTSPTFNPVRLDLEPFTSTCTTPWAFLASQCQGQASTSDTTMAADPSEPVLGGLNGVHETTFAAHPLGEAPASQLSFPPTWLPSLNSAGRVCNMQTSFTPATAVTTRRIAAPAAPVPSHLPQLQPSLNSSIVHTGTAIASITNTDVTCMSGHSYGAFQPSPADMILATPQPVFSPLTAPPLNAPLPVPLSLNTSSLGATIPSSFGPTPFCSRDQSTYVSAHWDKEDSWAKAQAAITGRQSILTQSGARVGAGNTCRQEDLEAKTVRAQGGNGDNGTIDPKWVSPAGSVWSTPSVTRVSSPHLPNGQTQAHMPRVHNSAIPVSQRSSPTPTNILRNQTHRVPPPFVFYKPSHLHNVVQMGEGEGDDEDIGAIGQISNPTSPHPRYRYNPEDGHVSSQQNGAPINNEQTFAAVKFPLLSGIKASSPLPHPSQSGKSSPLVLSSSLTLPPTPESTSHSLSHTHTHTYHNVASQGHVQAQIQTSNDKGPYPDLRAAETSSWPYPVSVNGGRDAPISSPGIGSGLCSTFDNGSRWYE
ncbi:hypothetical protein IAU59_005020 [Kwoniella sp. CBS 9459]